MPGSIVPYDGPPVARCPHDDPMTADLSSDAPSTKNSGCDAQCLTCVGPPCAPLPFTRWPRCLTCNTTSAKPFHADDGGAGPSCIAKCDSTLGYFQRNATHCGGCGSLGEGECEKRGCHWRSFNLFVSGERPPGCEGTGGGADASGGIHNEVDRLGSLFFISMLSTIVLGLSMQHSQLIFGCVC